MRLIHSHHLSYPALKAARVAIAAGAVAGLVVIAACTDNGGKAITAPQAPRLATTSSGGLVNGGHIDLCVTGPAGDYTFVNTQINRTNAQDGFGIALPGNGFFNVGLSTWFDPADGGTGTAAANALEGVNYTVTAGSCVRVIDRTAADPGFPSENVPVDSYSAATFQYTGTNTALGGAIYDHTNCLLDEGVLIPQQANPPASFPTWGPSGLSFNGVSTTYLCDNHNNPTRAFANTVHGAVITFVFTAPPQQTIPLFVIGDIEPHGIGDVVNFWGPQWWKNNPMTLFSTKGWESFKGYASSVDRTPSAGAPCGTWTSRVGNSPPPPQTIPEFVGIIVTNNVYKIGPGEGGTIQEILIVHSDGGYGPAPGHRGNGPVVSIECAVQD